MKNSSPQTCTICVMDTSDPNIVFDEKGVCQRCNQFHESILPAWNYGQNHQAELDALLDKIKEAGRNKQYDCLLGLSGGFDSSYMLHAAITQFKLRPLVFHVDAGWNTPISESNIQSMVQKLGVDLKIQKINWPEIRDIQLAFFKAGVPHLDTPQDNAFMGTLDSYAKKYGIKYILNGGNISTEVIVNPDSWSYWGTDKRQNTDICKKFGTIPISEFKFTNVLQRKIIIPYINGIKTVKLLNYIPYIKKDAEALLTKEYGFISYGQKHFESYLTKFLEGYWLPKRFGFDVRKPQLSSLILTNQLSRDEALQMLKDPPLSTEESKELFNKIAEILAISATELESYFNLPLKTYKDYKHQDWLFSAGANIMYKLKLDKLIRK